MLKLCKLLFAFFWISVALPSLAQQQKAPAYPLITHDPYFSIWSDTDLLNGAVTKHWTGSEQSMTGFLRVDGKLYRFLGKEEKNYQTVLPVATEQAFQVSYSLNRPTAGWMRAGFDDSQWKTGAAPFGDEADISRTPWHSADLWVRRSFTLNENVDEPLYLKLRHDDNIVVYLNGKEIYQAEGWIHKYKFIAIPNGSELLKKGENVLAVHIRNTAGGQHLDFGLVKEEASPFIGKISEAIQKKVKITATSTQYSFSCGPVDLELNFTSPLLISDLDILSRPVSYVTFKARQRDRRHRNIQLLFNVSSDLAVNTPEQEVETAVYRKNGLSVIKAGTTSQQYLKRKGDDLRIDWGYLHIATAEGNGRQFISSDQSAALRNFIGKTSGAVAQKKGRRLQLNTTLRLNANDPEGNRLMLAYDDIWSIQYFGTNLRPWWNRDNKSSIDQQLLRAHRDYKEIMRKCQDLDRRIYQDAVQAGGESYAKICEVSYRQVMAAHKLVQSPQGELLWLSKENFSNGCINTVDLTYPSAPLFLIYNPELVKGMMNGIFNYSESGRWKKPFAAHNLGTYPQANGQVYGEDMPVEESGNMIILAGAITKVTGKVDYARQHWGTLTTWTDYLVKEGFDPANQLCTDDFAGHLARNANLSLKAIMGIESYAYMAKMLGKDEIYQKYHAIAVSMVPKWMKLADDGDHFSLAFETKGTWSQKYNLIWDRVLGFHIFPREVYEKEMRYYLTRQKAYGLPLDSRKTYTKSDWIVWTACLTGNQRDFEALIEPLYRYVTETTTRVPLSDWYETTTGKKVGFQARSVIGGHWMKVLDHRLNP